MSRSQFPRARPKPTGLRRKRPPKPRPRCAFVASGHVNHRGIEICSTCDGLRTEPQHDWPETPEAAAEVDRRRAP